MLIFASRNALKAYFALLTAAAAAAADWPQLQCSPQRTGYTPDMPKPPYTLAWKHYFPMDEEKVHPQVQPVVYGGKVFVGTKQGGFYAFDARTGAVVWKWKDAKGPVLNTAACAGGKVVFSCLDGQVRALDVKDGGLLWAFDGGMHGFNTAPCIAGGRVFIGSREGVFYCLELESGAVVWRRAMERYIFCGAAWNEGRVYFGTEDMYFHCLDAGAGAELWKSEKLHGVSFKEFFPVAAGGRVMIRTVPNVDPKPVKCSHDYIKENHAPGRWAPVPAEASEETREFLKENPIHQSLYVFDEQTGATPHIVCHNSGGANDFHPALPAVDATGKLYIAITSEFIEPNFWRSLMFVSIDSKTGRFGEFLMHDSAYKFGGSTDEQENLSVGGDILFVSQQEEGEAGWWGAFNLRTTGFYSIPSSMRWAEGLNYNQQQSGGHAFAISGNRFYHIAFHCLGCWQGAEE